MILELAVTASLFFSATAFLISLKNRQELLCISRSLKQDMSRATNANQVGLSEQPNRPLERLRIALAITEDAEYNPFRTLLHEALEKEDAQVIDIDISHLSFFTGDYDIVITGEVTSKGYRNIFHDACLECKANGTLLEAIVARPPQGDRQENLVVTVVTSLKRKVETTLSRSGRALALAELRGETPPSNSISTLSQE
jgi:hypothetical protein